MTENYNGPERREFVRLDYFTPLAYKVCKKSTLSKLLQGYTSDISQAGMCCNIQENVLKDNILWLSFDRGVLNICREIENRCLIYQNGVLGKVVWSKRQFNQTFDIGIKFLTREEKNLSNIYPKAYFLDQNDKVKR